MPGRRNPKDFGISSFRISHGSGGLSPIASIPLEGNPIHIATDRKGKYLLSAYYYQQKAAVHAIGDGGGLGDPAVEWLQTDTGAHFIVTDPSNKFALVPHIADGALKGPETPYSSSSSTRIPAHLTPNSPPMVTPKEPEGPRHLCFHPDLDVVYSSNEQGCSVTAYSFNSDQGNADSFPDRFPHCPKIYSGQKLLLSDSNYPHREIPVRA